MWVFILQLVLLVLLSGFLIYYYAERSAPLYAKILVFLSFSICFLSFMILPIDIFYSSTPTPQNQQSLENIKKAWKVIYYINFFMCWLILPFAQEFQDSGEFSFGKKLKDAFLMNGILIGILCLGAIVIVVYLLIAGIFSFSQIPGVFAFLVNVFGLFLVSVMLGYGLISFPKQCFILRDYKRKVNQIHRQAELLKQQNQKTYQQVYSIKHQLDNSQRNDQRDPTEKRIVYTIIQQNFKFTNFRHYANDDYDFSRKSTAELHKLVKKRTLEKNSHQCQLDQLVDELTQITQSYLNNNYTRKKVYYTILFIMTTFISLIIFLSELSTFLTFLSPINLLSLFSSSSQASYVLNIFLTSYIAYIITHTIFRIKIYKIFSLTKKHSTASSLLFTAINLSRVSYPLCYNYSQIIQLPRSSFLEFFGDVTIQEKYAIAFPIIMLLFALINAFDIFDKIMGYLGLSSYAFDEQQQQQKIEQGRNILMERLKQRSMQNNNLVLIQLL